MSPKKKILVIGDAGVGKTNFIKRYIDNIFEQRYIPTGITRMYESKKFIFFDYPGQNKYQIKFPNEIDLCIIMYDVTNTISYKSIYFWILKVKEWYKMRKKIILLGNKIDMRGRKIFTQDSFNISVKNNEMTGLDILNTL